MFGGRTGPQHLDRNALVEGTVRALGTVHEPHPALARHFEQPIGPKAARQLARKQQTCDTLTVLNSEENFRVRVGGEQREDLLLKIPIATRSCTHEFRPQTGCRVERAVKEFFHRLESRAPRCVRGDVARCAQGVTARRALVRAMPSCATGSMTAAWK